MDCKDRDINLAEVVWQVLYRNKEEGSNGHSSRDRRINSYVVEDNILWKDHRCNLPCSSKLDYGYWPDIWRSDRKYLDRDQHIFDWRKLYRNYTQSSRHIQVDNRVDFQHNLASMSKRPGYFAHDTESWDRRVRVDKDWRMLVWPLCVGMKYGFIEFKIAFDEMWYDDDVSLVEMKWMR